MTFPDILVLDEPTSGLDTPNALSVVQTLREIVQSLNVTVVLSIHQPHKRICDCMDWIISLKDGQLMYQGTLPNAIKCRDIILDQIVSKVNDGSGSNLAPAALSEEPSNDFSEGDIVYNSDHGADDGEKKENRNVSMGDDYFDMNLIAT
eukprot:CAMPEP_0201574644 /NCGR_PEP_ID=MMETSP0190_2-20130828/19292_1 /ASSEMBLY_ACC=CAM_ASM_000263 /TAXON_ID=37353 /ORGANISM="Rosalina sp." /LENGTH=148 /DNA_ID=CAMNT_0048003199 /DNA_START=268 /DNA_END=710 /DNA_ORIENTATION=-